MVTRTSFRSHNTTYQYMNTRCGVPERNSQKMDSMWSTIRAHDVRIASYITRETEASSGSIGLLLVFFDCSELVVARTSFEQLHWSHCDYSADVQGNGDDSELHRISPTDILWFYRLKWALTTSASYSAFRGPDTLSIFALLCHVGPWLDRGIHYHLYILVRDHRSSSY